VVLGEDVVRVGEDGVLLVNLLPLDSQLAMRAFRQADEPTPPPTAVPLATETPTNEATATSALTENADTPTRTPIPTLSADGETPLTVLSNTPRAPADSTSEP